MMRGVVVLGVVFVLLDVVAAAWMYLGRGGAQVEPGIAYSTLAGGALAALATVGAVLLFTGARGGSVTAATVGGVIAALPVLGLAAYEGKRGVASQLGRFERGRFSRFDDDGVQSLAAAIVSDDPSAVRSRLAAGGTGGRPVDFRARNAYQKTILTLAIEHAAESATPESVESVRLLVEAGALKGEHRAEPDQFGHNDPASLLERVVLPVPALTAVLDVLLSGGLDPNLVPESGIPLFYRSYVSRETLEVLARHGADFTRENTNDPQLKGVNVAAWHALNGRWALVRWFLDHGVSPDAGPPEMSVRALVRQQRESADAELEALTRHLDQVPPGQASTTSTPERRLPNGAPAAGVDSPR